MKVFAILAIISICVAFAAAICCPIPRLNPKFGHGPVCTPCIEPPNPDIPCCENFHILPGMGHGPVCTKCAIAEPAANSKS